VTAVTGSEVLRLCRMDFLSAVLGNLESAEAVEEVVASREELGVAAPLEAVG